jgi:hypothetical protein
MLLGIDDIEAGCHDGDRTTTRLQVIDGLERAGVCLAIDATCQARHDVHSGLRETVSEVTGHVAAGPRRVAGTHDRHAPAVEQRSVAQREEHRGRQRIVHQQCRMVRVAEHRDLHSQVQALFPHLLGWTAGGVDAPRGEHAIAGEHFGEQTT